MSPLYSSLLILAAIILYGAIHSLLASLWAKAQAQRWFGKLAKRTYRLTYNLFAAASLIPVLLLPAILPDRPLYTIPFPWSLLAVTIQGLAGLILLVGLLQTGVWSFLGIEQLFAPPTAQPPKLVVSGLYRWVRHPLYTAGLAFLWFSPVMTWNLLTLNVGMTLYIVIGARFEERKLIHEYGDAYLAYRRRTPMLIPRPPRKVDSEPAVSKVNY